ncbi:unnamed protein product [Mesocestoides corti]|uniref:Uncharacterized protein n=1 Tax=Mesocestoides corti TaxID=53468 RepID=A0A0R3UKU6_MESCO|nr:unnamed protein product [Mesocestoides corti]
MITQSGIEEPGDENTPTILPLRDSSLTAQPSSLNTNSLILSSLPFQRYCPLNGSVANRFRHFELKPVAAKEVRSFIYRPTLMVTSPVPLIF